MFTNNQTMFIIINGKVVNDLSLFLSAVEGVDFPFEKLKGVVPD